MTDLEVMPRVAHRRPAAASPYRGLAPYTEDDSEWFFGRDEQVRIVATNLMSARITILYGESGVGKTSLLRAGVVPALRAEAERDADATGHIDFAVALHNRWQTDPIPALLGTIAAALPEQPDLAVEGGPIHLDAALSDVTAAIDADLLVILDQFEEWFLYHGGQANGADSELVRAMGRIDLPVHYLISLREDALAQLDRFKGHIPGLFDNLLRLHPLDRGGARRAIEAPLARYNAERPDDQIEIESDLVDRALDEVRAGAVVVGDQGQGAVRGNGQDVAGERIEAPFLQLVMTRLWDEERASGSDRLRLETLERLGGADRIVRTHLDQTMTAIDPRRRALAADAFNHLVTPSGTKIAFSVADLAEYTAAPRAELEELLGDLARMRILRPVARPDRDHPTGFEIFHDVLAPSVLDWRTRYLHERDLRARHRRLATIVAVLLMGIVILAIATVYFERRFTKASSQLDETRLAQVRASQATVLVDSDPTEAVRAALSAVDAAHSAVAENSLRAVLPTALRLRAVLRTGMPQVQAAFTVSDSVLTLGGKPNGSAGEATIWNIRTSRPVKEFRNLADPASPGALVDHCCAVLSDRGDRLVTIGRSRSARTWDLESGGHDLLTRGVQGAVMRDDDSRIFTWGDASVLWTGSGRRISAVPAAHVLDAGFTAENRLLTLDANGRLEEWSGGGGARPTPLASVPGPKELVVGPGRKAVVIPSAGLAQVVDLDTGPAFKLAGNAAPIDAAAFDSSGRHIVTASEDGLVRVYDAETGSLVLAVPTNGGAVKDATFSHNGAVIATATNDGRARLWNALGGYSYLQLAGDSAALHSVAFSPDDTSLVTTSDDGTSRVWTVEPNTKTAIPPTFIPQLSADSPQKLSADSPQTVSDAATARGIVAFASPQAGVFLWRPGSPPRRLTPDPSNGVAFSRDGRFFVTTTRPATPKSHPPRAVVWRTTDAVKVQRHDFGRPIPVVFHHPSFSPDGRSLVFATMGGAMVWRWQERGPRAKSLFQTPGPVFAATYSPDGRLIVTGDAFGRVRLWNAATFHQDASWPLGRAHVVTTAFDASGKHVAAGTEGGLVAIWDVNSGRRTVLPPLPAIVTDVRFSDDGQWIVIGSTDGTVRVWDWRRETVMATLQLHAGATRTAELVPGRPREILSTGDDGITEIAECATCVPLDAVIRLAQAHQQKIQ
jgi:WD40 repeat protein